MSVVGSTVRTPLGSLLVEATERGICKVHFLEKGERPPRRRGPGVARARAIVERAERALKRYFAGDRKALDGLPVETRGTQFQKKVWNALCEIPAGETRSYAEIARRIGCPKGFRAVGMANRANPVALVVPCHRVITSDGKLGGYAGNVSRKEWLLRHEAAR